MKQILFLLFLIPFYLSAQIQLNVKDFGAKPNDNIDDTEAFQKAIDRLKNKGGIITIPAGAYHITQLRFFGNKYSNITITGQNVNIIQIIKKNSKRRSVHNGSFQTYANRLQADGCFVFDALAHKQKDDRLSIKNIKIQGLTFISKVDIYGFDELLHQISASGVSNFEVTDCQFIGFLGDGIAINAGTHTQTHPYNKNITISNCYFDGINKDNRQAISIYYADGFLIENCSFKNTTRSNMPGAIDIEPGKDFLVVRNGIIRNCNFENIGGLAAICFVLSNSTKENYYSNKNFVVENCKFYDVEAPICFVGSKRTYDNYSNTTNPILIFRNSTVNNTRIVAQLSTAYGVYIENVDFNNITSTTLNILNNGGKHITFNQCSFKNIKHKNGIGFYGEGNDINILSSTFENYTQNAISFFNPRLLGNIQDNKFKNSYKKGFGIFISETKIKIDNKNIKNNTFFNTNSTNIM